MQPLVNAVIRVDVVSATSFNAVKRIMGYYFDGFRDAHGCMHSLCGNNEYGIWPLFANLSLDSHGIQSHFCNKDLPV